MDVGGAAQALVWLDGGLAPRPGLCSQTRRLFPAVQPRPSCERTARAVAPRDAYASLDRRQVPRLPGFGTVQVASQNAPSRAPFLVLGMRTHLAF